MNDETGSGRAPISCLLFVTPFIFTIHQKGAAVWFSQTILASF
jgi:hypothetical protein